MMSFLDRIPEKRVPYRGHKLRLERIKQYILNGYPVPTLKHMARNLSLNADTLREDINMPEFIEWHEKVVGSLIERKKKEILLATRASLQDIDLKELRNCGR